jgi:protein MpaA
MPISPVGLRSGCVASGGMRAWLPLALLSAAIALGACRSHEPGETAPTPAPPPSGLSTEGRWLEYGVYGHGGVTVLILATIHGDEGAGTPLLEALGERLAGNPTWLEGKRAVVVPVLNPDGVERRQRTNARGVDLNRNFPAGNWRSSRRHGELPLSEPESRFVADLIDAYRPATILSFHQAADLIDYDGPGGALAHHLAACSSLEVRRLGARAGSLGSYAGVDLKIPVITIELPRSADRLSRAEAWERYGVLLTEALRYDAPAPAEPVAAR